MTDAMKHQAKAAFEIHLRKIEIRNINQPPVPAFQQGVYKNDGSRYNQNMDGGQ